MISISAAVSALILSLTLGVASSSRMDATYDNLPAFAQVGVYQGVSYTNFDVAPRSELNESVSGIIPHSDPNVALTEPLNSALPSITAQYSGSNKKSISPVSVYYGCAAVSGQGVVSIAAPCNVTVKGYKAGSSSPSATQTLKFVPEEAVDLMNPLTFGTFVARFNNLQTVTFSVEPSVGVVFGIDNFVYSLTD